MISTRRIATAAMALILAIAVSMALPAAHADTLTLVGVGNGVTTPNGAEYVGPYNVQVSQPSGYQGTLDLYCLDIDRDVTQGESWQATPTQLSVNSSANDKTVALIIAAENAGKIGQTTAQLDIWGLIDPTTAEVDGLTLADISQLKVYQLEALNNDGGNAFYSQFTLETATPGTQTSGGTAQDFIGLGVPVAPTPEPGSLMLLGTGIIGAAGMLRKRFATA
jgi:hypothetical protein